MKSASTWAVACTLLMAATVAFAADAELSYYDVDGTQANELRSQMNAKGPLGKDGKRYDGRTDWYVAWNYRYFPSADGCRFTELDTKVTGTMTLPRWTDEQRSPPRLVRKWQRYMAALRVHEDGHYANAVKAAEEIAALKALRTNKDCGALVKLFERQAESILDKYRAADIAYDATTRHGGTQGATFP